MWSNFKHFFKNNSATEKKVIKSFDKVNKLHYVSNLNTDWRKKAIVINTGLLGLEMDHLTQIVSLASQKNLNVHLVKYLANFDLLPGFEEDIVGVINFDYGVANTSAFLSSFASYGSFQVNPELK